jgi:S-adenosylmethionine:tRNA ribosyltransferase-isomerase
MDTARYDYHLPKDLIARYPVERGTERLLILERDTGKISYRQFEDLISYLHTGDLLVLNDTRVIPARLIGRKETGGTVEVLLLKKLDEARWQCLIKASKKPKNRTILFFAGDLTATVENSAGDAFIVSFSDPDRVLMAGTVPLPPYLEREPEEADSYSYQTVYARYDGSVASPTAGLHFTGGFLKKIESVGVELVFVTLHVGLGTFTPVRTQTVEEHTMHLEEYSVTQEAALSINEAKGKGRRIVAVGTTTTRVLEHLMHSHGMIVPGEGSTDLFIYNGYDFKCTGTLLTNFHLPCSTLLMLVSAFGGYELVMRAYSEAIDRRFRFFSYGDAMLII